jgi:glucuronokinase
MDFSGDAPRTERLDHELLPPLLVAWRSAGAEDSGVAHSDLRARYDSGDPVLADRMAALTGSARAARAALLAGDQAAFARAVDETFDLRCEMLPLDPRHVEMVEIARGAGAAANYSGSGGSIVAVCRDAAHRDDVATALRSASSEVLAAT